MDGCILIMHAHCTVPLFSILLRWPHSTHRVAMATFWRTFHHDVKSAQPESIATLPPFGPIEGHKWFDQISSQWESQKNRFALIYFGKIRFLPPCIWNLPFMSYRLWWRGGGCTPFPFRSIYHHEQSCGVRSSWGPVPKRMDRIEGTWRLNGA